MVAWIHPNNNQQVRRQDGWWTKHGRMLFSKSHLQMQRFETHWTLSAPLRPLHDALQVVLMPASSQRHIVSVCR